MSFTLLPKTDQPDYNVQGLRQMLSAEAEASLPETVDQARSFN